MYQAGTRFARARFTVGGGANAGVFIGLVVMFARLSRTGYRAKGRYATSLALIAHKEQFVTADPGLVCDAMSKELLHGSETSPAIGHDCDAATHMGRIPVELPLVVNRQDMVVDRLVTFDTGREKPNATYNA